MDSRASRRGRSGLGSGAGGLGCACLLVLAACSGRPSEPAASTGRLGSALYTPGLGEIMSLQQMRHIKLWYAGQAGNWELALYEVDELGEGFDDVVAFHPTHKESPVAPKDAIPRIIREPLAEVRSAVESRDSEAFVTAYDALTAACNDCHRAMDFGFNVVGRPTSNPYSNQIFARPPGEE
jgi:hypothetical protein